MMNPVIIKRSGILLRYEEGGYLFSPLSGVYRGSLAFCPLWCARRIA